MRDEFKSYCHEGAHPSIIINNTRKLTVEQTLAVLQRILKAIRNGAPLTAEDSNEIGNKYTHSSWGLCSDNPDYWPTPELHTVPADFVDRGRVAPLDPGISCPMRTKGEGRTGCFYSCRIFQRHLKTPTREEAIDLYEKAIEQLQSGA